MSSLSDILDFERFNLRKIGRAIKEDPERLFLGALGPFGTELWGKVLGKDYGKLVNPLGAPVESTYEEAEAAGSILAQAARCTILLKLLLDQLLAGTARTNSAGRVSGSARRFQAEGISAGLGSGVEATRQPKESESRICLRRVRRW